MQQKEDELYLMELHCYDYISHNLRELVKIGGKSWDCVTLKQRKMLTQMVSYNYGKQDSILHALLMYFRELSFNAPHNRKMTHFSSHMANILLLFVHLKGKELVLQRNTAGLNAVEFLFSKHCEKINTFYKMRTLMIFNAVGVNSHRQMLFSACMPDQNKIDNTNFFSHTLLCYEISVCMIVDSNFEIHQKLAQNRTVGSSTEVYAKSMANTSRVALAWKAIRINNLFTQTFGTNIEEVDRQNSKNGNAFNLLHYYMGSSFLDFLSADSQKLLFAIKVCLTLGIDINAQDHYGRTALHLAVKKRRSCTIAYLIENGAKLTIQNQKYKTPLETLAEEGFKDALLERHKEFAARHESEAAKH